jgi:hypothetical protein
LGIANYFIVNKVKQNVAQVLRTKSCVIWRLRHLDASMKFWVQTRAIHVHEFIYLVLYMCTYSVKKIYVITYQPTILSHSNVMTYKCYQMAKHHVTM